ncbi:DUF2092 domain-containing protein [Lysobacter sp. S4-A87]|uniref:DUF2092 domain-containing protein n=1 Tax=Lysobacter sp. S4-A87 TaxID=2925843 RepID=UPI001F52FD77|nr:DUF2092 domain-containing protein [Lysobacter sp. S4-A87]UNK51032.1 DUF2092 domain-containing protein [Lysobacter sp. S4-A87]
MRHTALITGLCLALAAPMAMAAPPKAAKAPTAAAAPAPAPDVEPEAVAALEAMGKYLRSLKDFTVHADTTLDIVVEDGQKLQFAGDLDYKVRAPDKLQLDLRSDRKERQLFYDGKSLTVYGPKAKYYATVDAPPTIREMLGAVEQKYGIEIPLADLFLWGTDQAPTSALKSATRVGPARIGGTITSQYAFRQEGVDWQVWIEAGPKPLPRRLVITTTDDPAQPQYASTLTWNTAAGLKDSAFTFAPPKDSHRIEMVEVDVVAVEEKSP